MVQPGQITLYTHPYSPYGHRAHIALEEAKANYTTYTLNLMDKPSWYVAKVNPVGKIPAITYGGPKASPEDPSPESAKIAESMVIVEFVAELFPESNLHPTDLVQRARARIFVTVVEGKLFEGFKSFFFMSGPATALLDGLEAVQARLAETGFAVGEWSIADVAAAPLLLRIKVLLEHDIGKYPVGDGRKVFKEMMAPKFARLIQYIEDIKRRHSVQATYNEEEVLEMWANNPFLKRNQ